MRLEFPYYPKILWVAAALCPLLAGVPAASAITPLFSIGQPTNEEQLYVENINRARANPPAEGVRLAATTDAQVRNGYSFFGVNLTLMQSQFAAIATTPPLSINPLLTAAARRHSQDMFAHAFQDHSGSDGSTPGSRLAAYLNGANGYSYGENIFAHSQSVWYGHAALEVDWGGATGGMQSPPGHRENIHSSSFREIGVGVVFGTNGSVGPQLVTQDFGARGQTTPFITGVAFRDANNNGVYDLGEGVGGLSVSVAGSAYAAVTAAAGGYSVPVPGDGSYMVTFSSTFVPTFQRAITVGGGNNVKVDYVLPGQALSPALHNVSTRAFVGSGDSVLIGGIIVHGTAPKNILVRALGPSLAQFNVPAPLTDPTIELHDQSGAIMATNDNWGSAGNAASIPTSLRPSQDAEAAIMKTVTPGSYTVVLRGAGGATGTALLETYDLDTSTASELTNISTRGLVQTGDRVMIAGFIVQNGNDKVVVRALGPTLAGFGVISPLADPNLELRDSNGALVMANDNWKSSQEAELSASGYAPSTDSEPALVRTLSPGNYTAIVRGANSTSGVVLVEVYGIN